MKKAAVLSQPGQAPAWASRPCCHRGSGSGIPSLAMEAIWDAGAICPSAHGLPALQGRCVVAATTENKPVRRQVTAFSAGGVWAELT